MSLHSASHGIGVTNVTVRPSLTTGNDTELLGHYELGTEVMPGRLDSSLRFIDINFLSQEALGPGFIAVLCSCDELINSIGLSGLHPRLPSPSRHEPEGLCIT